MSSTAAFDPFVDLVIAQGERPDHVAEVNLRALSPFQRALLVIDGTVTKFIEAYTMEPVHVERLHQETRPLEQDNRWLEVPAHTAVAFREVLLRGAYSETLYAYATSLLVPSRLPGGFASALETEPSGLGRVLLDSGAESRREVLWFGRERLSTSRLSLRSTGIAGDYLTRTYRVISGGEPMMLINEKFPLGLENLPAHH